MKTGNQEMEAEHSGQNDSLQDTQKCHGGAGTKPVAPHGSEQKGAQEFYSEQSAVHQVQPKSLQAQAALLLLVLPRWQGSTTLCFILLQEAVSSQGVVLSHGANQEEEVCLLGSSAGVAL